jgi:hypothetical protein
VLRERLRTRATDRVTRQPGDYEPATFSRFRFFIKIGREVTTSVAESLPHKIHWSDNAFVKIVDSGWEPSPALMAEEQEGAVLWEPIEGCIEEDDGWMRIAPVMIIAYSYETLNDDEQWYLFYECPLVDFITKHITRCHTLLFLVQ